MSANRLREAAALMRERAEAATPGPWEVEHLFGDQVVLSIDPNEQTYGTIVLDASLLPAETWDQEAKANAEHIASWHPIVALAVADWLTGCAAVLDAKAHSTQTHALAVANAYLGSDK